MLSYYTATTLDGFIADADDSLEWLLRQPIDQSGPFSFEHFIKGIGAIVMGSTTYRWVRKHLVHAGEPWPYSMPCWVMSSGEQEPVDGGDIRFANGDVRPVYERMTRAAGDKGLWVVGGGDLAGQFADAGLLDEVIVSIAPVTLGTGRPVLPRRLDLELIELVRNEAFACARYRVAGTLAEDSGEPIGATA
ncbi:MAG TPA: dihydrofolate reductase family protein [Candidatus Agrococcus pullicola]|uniref:Dihydrofolate reductase family protein n=1 Tax=Candidatus Agrococcus pullicola TaxID=2838429 RepID=A0A9D1YWZ5_9MICO|nr:dihydrofolate reductase family protein [Candidatus Agrococcus pullicola]